MLELLKFLKLSILNNFLSIKAILDIKIALESSKLGDSNKLKMVLIR